MLTRNTPSEISTVLLLQGPTGEIKLPVVYFNRNPDELQAEFDEYLQLPDDVRENMPLPVLKVVKSWEAEYELSNAGLTEAERDHPGVTNALIRGYHQCRMVNLVGNLKPQ